jgi:uncharacterized protein (DUF2147 family)
MLIAGLAWTCCCLPSRAATGSPDGTWLIGDRMAIEIAECNYLYCGRVVWQRQPEPGMCGKTIVRGLTPAGAGRWNDGWFYDADSGQTFNFSASLRPDGTLSGRLLNLVQLYGRVETQQPIAAGSRSGWCPGGAVRG